MFDKFGEFNSSEEINRAAAAQKAEGDEEALRILAVENGLDSEDAEDYMDDCTEELCTPLMAAMGKLKVEAEEYNLAGILLEWVDELKAACSEDIDMAVAVRKKGKGLDGYIAELASTGFKEKAVVDTRIVHKCSSNVKNIVGNHPFYIGVPNKANRKEIMNRYYLEA